MVTRQPVSRSERAFDLWVEPWIPVVLLNGERSMLGLRDALILSHDILELRDESPLRTAAVFQLLLAILYRVYDDESEENLNGELGWRSICQRGRFDCRRIDEYAAAWRDRFFLFHPKYPFYQRAGLDSVDTGTKKKKGLEAPSEVPEATEQLFKQVSKLSTESTARDSVLFEWARSDEIEAAEALRRLLQLQAFALGGGNQPETTLGQHPNSRDGVFAKGAINLVKHETLFRTLMANLVPLEVYPESDRGIVAWEMESRIGVANRHCRGIYDYLTWTPRAVRLVGVHTLESNSSRLLVTGAYIAQDDEFPEQWSGSHPFFVQVKGKERSRPISIDASRSLWRDAHTFLPSLHEGGSSAIGLIPKAVLFARDVEDGSTMVRIETYGLARDQAKPLMAAREQLPVPVEALNNSVVASIIRTATECAERGEDSLHRATSELFEILGRPKPSNDMRGRKLEAKYREQATREYWSSLGGRFAPFMRRIADAGTDAVMLEAVIAEWKSVVGDDARRAFGLASGWLTGRAPREGRAVADGQRSLNSELRKHGLHRIRSDEQSAMESEQSTGGEQR